MTSSILQDAAAGKAIIQPWTVQQYHFAIENGLLAEDPAFELLNGFIIRKDRAKAGENPKTIGDRHRIAVSRLAQMSSLFEPHNCFLQSQQPITLPPHSEPEPDIAIIRGVLDDYLHHAPTAADVVSVIEVADDSLSRDLGTKLRMYARAGIQHYVVVDLVHNVVLVHSAFAGSGTYHEPASLSRGQTLAIPTGGSQTIDVAVSRLLP